MRSINLMTVECLLILVTAGCNYNPIDRLTGKSSHDAQNSSEAQINPPPINANFEISLVSTNEDRASTQGVFGSGPGFKNNLFNDFHWSLKLKLAHEKYIKSILLTHAVSGEVWTTTSIKRTCEKFLYPLVVLKDATQLNSEYDQLMGPFKGDVKLDLFGQIESRSFRGGEIVITFSDRTIAKTSIPESALAVIPLENQVQVCADSDNGATYSVKGEVNYSLNGVNRVFSDYCLTEKIVAEGMCGGNDGPQNQLVLSLGTCDGHCQDGACK